MPLVLLDVCNACTNPPTKPYKFISSHPPKNPPKCTYKHYKNVSMYLITCYQYGKAPLHAEDNKK